MEVLVIPKVTVNDGGTYACLVEGNKVVSWRILIVNADKTDVCNTPVKQDPVQCTKFNYTKCKSFAGDPEEIQVVGYIYQSKPAIQIGWKESRKGNSDLLGYEVAMLGYAGDANHYECLLLSRKNTYWTFVDDIVYGAEYEFKLRSLPSSTFHNERIRLKGKMDTVLFVYGIVGKKERNEKGAKIIVFFPEKKISPPNSGPTETNAPRDMKIVVSVVGVMIGIALVALFFIYKFFFTKVIIKIPPYEPPDGKEGTPLQPHVLPIRAQLDLVAGEITKEPNTPKFISAYFAYSGQSADVPTFLNSRLTHKLTKDLDRLIFHVLNIEAIQPHRTQPIAVIGGTEFDSKKEDLVLAVSQAKDHHASQDNNNFRAAIET
ncbi:hypothetical protein QZH41_008690 [Actinostola sp. cb2023]|nr:hypothetical protein QZH41_008690 [Actinostola sp. cb2023]